MIRILLVDDHPVLRHGTRSLLDTQRDLEVVADAGSMAEAVTAVQQTEIDVALVDLDLGAGEPSGFDTTRAIVRARPGIRVVVFTAYDSDADVVQAVDAGAAGYLVKDSKPNELFQAIRSAAAGAGAMAAPIAERLRQRNRFTEEALTARELEVLTLAASGLSNRDLARELLVSEATVKTHLHHAFTKLQAENRQAAIAVAVKRGLIRL